MTLWSKGQNRFTPGRESAKVLAEIFFLQLEATLRANNEESARAPKFVAYDLTIVPGSKKPRTTSPRSRQ
jgi:hypothetical protein